MVEYDRVNNSNQLQNLPNLSIRTTLLCNPKVMQVTQELCNYIGVDIIFGHFVNGPSRKSLWNTLNRCT